MKIIPEEYEAHDAGAQVYRAAAEARRSAADQLERAMWHANEGRHDDAKVEYDAAIASYRAAATHFNKLADILEGLLKEKP